MSLIEWSDALSVGIPSIDEQHKRLVAILNELHDGMQAKKSREALGPVLQKLIAYTVEHFSYEESLFAKTSYAEATAHKAEHETLKAKVKEIQHKYETSVTGVLSIEVMNFLRSWLTDHIQGVDKKYVPHLSAGGIT